MFVVPALVALAAAFGCRHNVGWADRHTRVTVLVDESSTLTPALRVIRLPAAGSGLIEVETIPRRPQPRLVRRELVARRTYVPYSSNWEHFLSPFVKPFLMITIIPPFVLAYMDPHNHDGGEWNGWDYARDVLGYFNLFEPVPGAAQKVEKEWTVLRSEDMVETVPLPPGGPPGALALRTSVGSLGFFSQGSGGVARFDLARVATPELAEEDRVFHITWVRHEGERVLRSFVVHRKDLEGLLSRP